MSEELYYINIISTKKISSFFAELGNIFDLSKNNTVLFFIFSWLVMKYEWNGITSVSDPDPYQETLIWIRVGPKINQNHGINTSKWFVNVLFT